MSKENKSKMTKTDISSAAGLENLARLGWDPDKGSFDMNKIDDSVKELFSSAGITERDMQNEETSKFIYDFIEKNGGIDAVKKDQSERRSHRPSNIPTGGASSSSSPAEEVRSPSSPLSSPHLSPSTPPNSPSKLRKSSKKKSKSKLTTEDVGPPTEFQHLTHIGWNPNEGFSEDTNESMEFAFKELFALAGITERDMEDKETSKFVYDFIETQGGIEAVKKGQSERRSQWPSPIPTSPGGASSSSLPHEIRSPSSPLSSPPPSLSTPPTSPLKLRRGSKKKNKSKLTTDDIGAPTDFQHLTHMGWDLNEGFDMNKVDDSVKELFSSAGITEKDMENEETAKFIYDFIEKNGGIDAVKNDREKRRSLRPPSSDPSQGDHPSPIPRKVEESLAKPEPAQDENSENKEFHPSPLVSIQGRDVPPVPLPRKKRALKKE